MDYRILGPLEVCRDGRTVRLGGDKQRALLAILLLHAGEVVSADELIDGLWGERPPPTALKALQVHVSRLRSAIDRDGDSPKDVLDGVLVTRGHGYLLRVAPGELDLDLFRGLVEEGRRTLASGDAARAAGLLRDALALWRGPPLADLTYEAFAQRPIVELEELHLGAMEERAEADLALGRHEQLIGELRALVDENPLRERLRGQLMLALYRCGREAEALEIYQAFRRGLAEELGLDPSLRLQRLEAAILERDRSLDAPAAGPPPAEATLGKRPPRRLATHRGRWRLAAAGLVLVALAVAVAALVSRGSARPSTITADSVGAISPSGGAITATVPVGATPSSVAAGEGAVWVANYNDGTVSRIDPATGAVVEMIPAVSTPSGIAVGFGAVWVANNFSGTVSRIDPAVNRVVERIRAGNGPSGIASGYGYVWVANSSDGTLSRIDPVTGAARTIRLGAGATDVAVGQRAVWVSDEANGRVLRVDPRTDQIQPIMVGSGPTAITVGYGSVWVANSLSGTVSRIDPQSDQVTAAIAVGEGPSAIAAGAGAVWVANEFGDTVARISPATNTVAQ
jgi:YVTN family beta-propeller protein